MTRERAFDDAFARHGEAVVRYLRKHCDDFALVQDLAQQLWCYVWTKFSVDSFRNFGLLKRKAYGLLIDELRKRNVRSFAEPMASHPEVHTLVAERTFTATDEALLEERFWEEFPDVDLTADQKRAFVLYKLHEYTLAEVAQMMGKPLSTVADWMEIVRRECVAAYKKANP